MYLTSNYCLLGTGATTLNNELSDKTPRAAVAEEQMRDT
jgi:hypothetical protein